MERGHRINRRCDYVNFPICLLKKYWEEGKEDLDGLITYIFCYGWLTSQITKEKTSKVKIAALCKVKDNWMTKSFDIDNENARIRGEIEALREISRLVRVGIEINKLVEFASVDKSEREVHELLAELAIKSIIGRSVYCSASWKLVIHRMCGFTKMKEVESYNPEEIKWAMQYLTRRKRDSLIKRLRLHWGLAYIPICRNGGKPFYSFAYSEKQLITMLAQKGITPVDMKECKLSF